LPSDPTVTLDFAGETLTAARVVVEVKDNNVGATAQVHIREISFAAP
jgi:hypothetical protein